MVEPGKISEKEGALTGIQGDVVLYANHPNHSGQSLLLASSYSNLIIVCTGLRLFVLLGKYVVGAKWAFIMF